MGVSGPVLPRAGRGRSAWRESVGLLVPWRGQLGLVALLVLVAAGLELVPPFVLRRVIDSHLIPGNPDGLLGLALLYLGATAATEVVTFLYVYLTSVAA